MDSTALFECLFTLFDRDGSGYAQEADVVAALTCATMDAERSRRMLSRIEESGRPDLTKFQTLLEACVDLSMPSKGQAEPTPDVRTAMLVKLALAVVKDFEQRATKAEQFREAASARECMAQIRADEEARQYDSLSSRQTHERKGVQEAQALEVTEFSGAWKASLAEYEESARQVVQQLRERHEAAYSELLEVEKAAAQQRVHRHSKEALEAMRVQERLVLQGDFKGAGRCTKRINSLLKRDEAAMLSQAEVEVGRKVDALRGQQRLEMEGLMLRVERNRAEHRWHWQQNASRMVLAQKNMASELEQRQSREAHRAHTTIRTQLEPLLRPSGRRVGNASYGVKGALKANSTFEASGFSPARYPVMAPRTRPSKMFGAASLCKTGNDFGAATRPSTVQGLPQLSARGASPRAEVGARPQTSG